MRERFNRQAVREHMLATAEDATINLKRVLRERACRQGIFRLASGKESDFFIDCKPVVLTDTGHRMAGEALCGALVTLLNRGCGPFDAVAGVALGGCPLASAVSIISNYHHIGPDGGGWNALYVRKEAKDHGTQNLIEGVAPAGSKVVLLEDVITTGGSAIAAIKALTNAGFTVKHVVALVDRKDGGVEKLAEIGVRVTSLYTRDDFVDSID